MSIRKERCFDAAVLGLGTMGSFTCLEIARRGASVIGLDRFAPPHGRGSHSGETRVYREAYTEHPDYVPIAVRAGRLWDEFGEEAGSALLHRSGMLYVGAINSGLLSGVRASAAAHALRIEELTAREATNRFPAFGLSDDSVAIFEPTAGWVDVNRSISFALAKASQLGADVRLNTVVENWQKDGSGFRIQTSEGLVLASGIVVAAGAWAGPLLADLKIPLRILRKVLIWVHPLRPELFASNCFPVFAYSDLFFYGFPDLASTGVKISIHRDTNALETAAEVAQSPPDHAEMEPILRIAAGLVPELAGHLPGALNRVIAARTCLYTMTPDENLILDRHPLHANVVFGAGFSGHGFKFAPAIGEALAEMILGGQRTLPTTFLCLRDRFANLENNPSR